MRSLPKSLSVYETIPIAWFVLLFWLSWGTLSVMELYPMFTVEGTLGPLLFFVQVTLRRPLWLSVAQVVMYRMLQY